MAVNDLTNKQTMIKDFMLESLRSLFPNVDLSETSAFMETFGMTHIKLLEPLLEYVDRLSLMQSIENASLLTEEEMDRVAENEYFYRKPGEKSTGEVTLVFRDVPTSGTFQLPAGMLATSRQGYRFISMDTITIDQFQLANYYDSDNFLFKIPVRFMAEDTGIEYNVASNDIKTLETNITFLEYVYNEAPFTGGTDRETNEELAQRIKEGAKASNLGTEKGYLRFIKENFATVSEVLVAGFGHPLMQRDIIGVVPNDSFNQTVRNVHWGSKVDVYIRGESIEVTSASTTVTTLPNGLGLGVVLLSVPVYDIQIVSFISSDPNVDQTQLVITDYSIVRNNNIQTVGTIFEECYLVIRDARAQIGSSVRVSYRYDSLPQEITTLMYTDDYRPPTADVRIFRAVPKYLIGSVVTKSKTSVRLTDGEKAIGRQNAYQYVNSLTMGSEFQFSDLHDEILHGDSANEVLDYIKMPSQFLLLHSDNDMIYDCLSAEQLSLLNAIANTNSYMHNLIAGFRYELNVYDFLDALYILSANENVDNALGVLASSSLINQTRADRIKFAREFYLKGNAASMLMPATENISENEYYKLKDLHFYEHKYYSASEWNTLFMILENYARLGAEDYTVMDLTCYCLSIIYVIRKQETLVNGVSPFFAYMLNVTKGSPLQDRFYI